MTDTVKSGRWIITGQFQLITSMHIGTGLDEKADKQSDASVDKKQDNPWIQAIALDQNEKPYIPGASIKGALKALARRYYCASNLNIFGDTIDIKDRDNKRKSVAVAGQAEFLNAGYSAQQQDKLFDTVTRVAINRITGTAEDKKLFNTRRVNPGARFDYKIVVQNACETEIKILLGLLNEAAKDPSFSLGAGANQSQGKIRCLSSHVRYFGKQEMHDWFRAIQNGGQERWQSFAKPSGITPARLEQSERIAAPLNLPLVLDFHTPFLVKAADTKSKSKDKGKDKNNNEADAKPRTNHQGQVILPASSLRGRLRAQAEKILRTLCQDIPQGHAAPAYDGNGHHDLINLLFGTAGWKGIVRATDLIHCIPEYALQFNGVRETISDLGDTVKSCIIVDLVETSSEASEKSKEQLHIRIVDSTGSLIVHKSEDSCWANDNFRDASVKDNFKAKLKEIADPQDLNNALREDIKKRAFQLATLTRHEMVAIDRFTGGGKEGAKFNVDYVECPTLTGALDIEIQRLRNSKLKNDTHALKPALGLISLLLRDLTEGDIPFGFGVNKGYGQCRAQAVLHEWSQRLEAIENGLTVNQTLEALRTYLDKPESHSLPPFDTLEAANATTDDSPATLEKPTNRTGLAFHNPYHFIPLNNPEIGDWREAKPETLKANGEGHDQYHTDRFSGRIVCRLTTQTPLFIGAETTHQGDDWEPTETKPFKLNGKHAIPATSLRGMLSSLFESISNSNFRVLHPEPYSIRKSLGDYFALSAMGRIVDDQGELKLQPLTLPTLRKVKTSNNYLIPKKWQKVFNDCITLRVYFHPKSPYYSSNQCYGMKLDKIVSTGCKGIDNRDNRLRFSSKDTYKNSAIGQTNGGELPIVENAIPEAKKNRYTSGYVRTLIDSSRTLPNTVQHHVFLPDTTDQIDSLVIPEEVKNRFQELADLALAGMHIKPGETKADIEILPYTPIGRDRPDEKQSKSNIPRYGTRLKAGDIVFFDVNEGGQITEISFSSIWRVGIGTKNKLHTTADLLSQHDPNLVQLGMGARTKDTDRFKLSPAERLFGAVEHRDGDNPAVENINQSSDKAQAFAFAGKVRIGFGLPPKEKTVDVAPPVILKELSSPKPPSPAFYLKRKHNDDFVSKKAAAEGSETMTLRGRKYYLHAWREQNGSVMKLDAIGANSGGSTCKYPWKTHKPAANDQKEFEKEEDKNKFITSRQVKIAPISQKMPFHFEIDFSNLDAMELAQLCATLQPAPKFEHRLGMGKPLGLGSVKIEPVGLYLINRHQRYATNGLDCDRYQCTWLKGDQIDKDWPDYLKQQKISINCEQEFNNVFGKLVRNGLNTIASEDIKRALELFGDPVNTKLPVHYPLEENRKEKVKNKETGKEVEVEYGLLEHEGFKWFVNNDTTNNKSKLKKTPSQPQFLEAITKDSKEIPVLRKNKVEKQDNRNKSKQTYPNHRR